MSFETRRLMVAYFTGGNELIAAAQDKNYAKLPQHMVISPWFQGEQELAIKALDEVASSYPAPIDVATGSFIPVGKNTWRISVHPEDELYLLHRRVVEALGSLALYPEDDEFRFKPEIIKDIDQPPLPASVDLEIDHLALVQDHQTGSYSIPDCVPLGNS